MKHTKEIISFKGNGFRRWQMAGLAVAVSFSGMLTSCSDDDDFNGPVIDQVQNVVGNNPADQADRITFYGKLSARSSRAAEDFPSIGSLPTIPEGTPTYANPNAAQQDWQNESRKAGYVLEGGNGQIELYGETNVYITGDVSTHNINGAGGTIYVMPEGSLTLTCNVQNCTIKAFGELKTGQNAITVGREGNIFVEGNLLVHGRFAVEGLCVVKNDLTVDDMLQVSNGRVKAKCIDVHGNNNEGINMSGGGELAARSYLTTTRLYVGDNARVYLWPNAMADITEKTTMTSRNAGFFYYTSEGKSAHALLNTELMRVEGSADDPAYITGMFAHELKLDYNEFSNANPALTADFPAPAEDYYIPADGCNPGHAAPGKDKPTFDPIAVIEGPTHTHDYLSATCVQAFNGKAYVSYHLNEGYADNADHADVNKHQGCVEVYDVDDTHADITSWLLNTDHDFNHLIVDNGKMYTVGDMKKGGQLGIITLEADGQFGQQSATMETVKLKGTSGNCIIRDGSYFRIATNYGFQSLNVDTFEDAGNFIATSGSAKHLCSGDGVIAVLSLDARGVASSPATVAVYNNWGNPTAKFSVSDITPINGKNVIAVDGGYVYVCLGENGVEKYTLNGQKVASYSWIKEHPTTKGRPCANGLAVDDQYIYIAYGGVGLLVLDKNLNRVARYYHKDDATNDAKYSANYVALVNGYIYIAYGRNGLEVVKMNAPVK